MKDEKDPYAQRISFAYGNAHMSNPDITREMVEQAAARMKQPDPEAINELTRYAIANPSLHDALNWMMAGAAQLADDEATRESAGTVCGMCAIGSIPMDGTHYLHDCMKCVGTCFASAIWQLHAKRKEKRGA